MPRRRRPAIAAEAERRSQERRTRIGGDLKAMRIRRRWTQEQLGERTGIGRMDISRIERGAGRLDLVDLERLAIGLGVPLNVAFGRDPKAEVADAGHLGMQELVLRLGRAKGMVGGFELPTRPAEPWRAVDVVLSHEAGHAMLCVECWNTIGDIGAAVRSSVRKLAELEAMAVGRWGEDAKVGLVWVVRATARNRTLLAKYPEIFAARFPGSSRGWVAALTGGAAPPDETGLIWCDVAATRLFEWRARMGELGARAGNAGRVAVGPGRLAVAAGPGRPPASSGS